MQEIAGEKIRMKKSEGRNDDRNDVKHSYSRWQRAGQANSVFQKEPHRGPEQKRFPDPLPNLLLFEVSQDQTMNQTMKCVWG